jgi:hypothetical protein
LRFYTIMHKHIRERHQKLVRRVARVFPEIQRIEHWYGIKLYINGQLWRGE